MLGRYDWDWLTFAVWAIFALAGLLGAFLGAVTLLGTRGSRPRP